MRFFRFIFLVFYFLILKAECSQIPGVSEEVLNTYVVHCTNILPKNGLLAGGLNWDQIQEIKQTGSLSSLPHTNLTTHWNLGGTVAEHGIGAKWSSMKFAILVPVRSFMNYAVAGISGDVFGVGPYQLPENSVIICVQEEIDNALVSLNLATVSERVVGFDSKQISLPKVVDVYIKSKGKARIKPIFNDQFKEKEGFPYGYKVIRPDDSEIECLEDDLWDPFLAEKKHKVYHSQTPFMSVNACLFYLYCNLKDGVSIRRVIDPDIYGKIADLLEILIDNNLSNLMFPSGISGMEYPQMWLNSIRKLLPLFRFEEGLLRQKKSLKDLSPDVRNGMHIFENFSNCDPVIFENLPKFSQKSSLYDFSMFSILASSAVSYCDVKQIPNWVLSLAVIDMYIKEIGENTDIELQQEDWFISEAEKVITQLPEEFLSAARVCDDDFSLKSSVECFLGRIAIFYRTDDDYE